MPRIKKEIFLDCGLEETFAEMSKFDFIKRINSSADVSTKMVFQNGRVIKYCLDVKGIGNWESERILIPESNLIITHRQMPLKPFKYMVVIYILTEVEQGTKFTYLEDFEVEDGNIFEEKIFTDISKKADIILGKISDYFNKNSK